MNQIAERSSRPWLTRVFCRFAAPAAQVPKLDQSAAQRARVDTSARASQVPRRSFKWQRYWASTLVPGVDAFLKALETDAETDSEWDCPAFPPAALTDPTRAHGFIEIIQWMLDGARAGHRPAPLAAATTAVQRGFRLLHIGPSWVAG